MRTVCSRGKPAGPANNEKSQSKREQHMENKKTMREPTRSSQTNTNSPMQNRRQRRKKTTRKRETETPKAPDNGAARKRKHDIIVECKAPKIKITQATFDQIARYNLKLKANYLIVTNGLEHFYCKMDFENETYIFLKEIPDYE